MAALPYIQLYIADYLADTAHLTTEQHGAYLLLIFNYWQRGKPLDNTNERLASVARLSNERWTVLKPTLIEFFTIDGNEWRHLRIDNDLKKVAAKALQYSLAGKASGVVRSAKANKRSIKKRTNVQRSQIYTDTESDTDTDTESDNKSIERTKCFVKPSPEEVTEYAKSKGQDLDGQVFYDFYESKGWMVGKNKMTDWKRSVTGTWKNWKRKQEGETHVSKVKAERAAQAAREFAEPNLHAPILFGGDKADGK